MDKISRSRCGEGGEGTGKEGRRGGELESYRLVPAEDSGLTAVALGWGEMEPRSPQRLLLFSISYGDSVVAPASKQNMTVYTAGGVQGSKELVLPPLM